MKHTHKHSLNNCDREVAGLSAKRKRFFKVLFLLLIFSFFKTATAQNALVPFTFNLTAKAKTSAGVYKRDGTLIRTLWSNVSYPAGSNKGTWDRRDDEGRLVVDTGYIVKVLSNNVSYTWENVLGNTSDSGTGCSKIHTFQRMNGMAVNNDTAYFCVGYSEASTAAHKLDFKHPQSKTSIMQDYNTGQATDNVTTDGRYVYWAGVDPLVPTTAFVYATKVSDDKDATFSSGVSVPTQWGRTYKSGIDVVTNNKAGVPTGVAVQKNGIYLFVSHEAMNEVHVLNKTTGALVQTLSVTTPRKLCMDPNDNLWMVSGTNTVAKYTVNSNGTLSSAVVSISGLLDPVAIAVSPNNNLILVADAGLSQQVKAFRTATGASKWTLGQYGGYSSDPTVTNTKFYFSDSSTEIRNSFIAFQSDSSFWVGDPGNERVQHFSSSQAFIDRIMSMPHSYSVYADENDPTRVFNEFLEFKIDYSKPLAANNGSWTLVRNWRHGIPANRYQDFKTNIFREVSTLSNGRTYALMDNYATKGYVYPEVVELPSSGQVRFTGIFLKAFSKDVMTKDGSFVRLITDCTLGNKGYWEYRKLTGFDNSYNPVWAAADTIATLPAIKADDPAYQELSYPEITSSDVLVLFNPGRTAAGYHLGGIKAGDNKYLWRTAKSTATDYKGPYPSDGGFDIGNDVIYPGGNVYAIEKNIFWNYHGEFWKNSQTNIWHHVYDDGLSIGQFGIPAVFADQPQASTMGAGNVFSAAVVKVGSDYYIYHNDESLHGGVHRWKITGLNTIQEQTLQINTAVKTGGLTGVYFDGTDMNNFNRVVSQVDQTVNLSTPPNQLKSASNFSTRWSGYFTPAYSEVYTFYTNTSKGVKLWIDNNLVINQWKNSSQNQYSYTTPVKLEAGKAYMVRMDIGGGTATLSWSSASVSKQVIPSSNLYPSEFPDNNNGVDLMEGLPYKSILENGLYGWGRNPLYEDMANMGMGEFWSVKTNAKSCDINNPDVMAIFGRSKNDSAYYVTRDLGAAVSCMSSWKVKGEINFEGNTAMWDQYGGSYFDILDDQGKVISRITNELNWNAGNPTQVKCNGTAILDDAARKVKSITNTSQPFEIYTDTTGVTFSYANLTPIKVKLFDSKSHWNKPTTIKFHFWGGASNYGRSVSVQKMRFITDAGAVPTITVAGATTFCAGDSVTLTSSTAASYLWSNNATTQSIKVKASGNYSVSASNGSGCSATSLPTTVTVNALPSTPSITASGPLTFCTGDSVTLTSGSATSYLWSNGVTTQSIKVKTSGSYKVKVSNSNGCSATSAATTVTVNTLMTTPVITAGGATTFCNGDSVTLTSSSANNYLWSNGAITQSIKAKTAGNYVVIVGNGSGCSATSSTTKVTVNALPTATITPGGPTTFCNGDSVTLNAGSASAYLWNNNATTQSIKVKTSGNYYVKVTNANGCSANSSQTTITVNTLPATPSVTPGGATSFCSGGSVALNASSASAYLWNNNATTQNINISTSGSYYVKVTNGNGCSSTSAATTVTVNSVPATPTISAGSATTFCTGDSVTLTSSSASAYLWNNGATTQAIKVKTSGSYNVTVTNSNACSSTSASTTVTVNSMPATPTITASGATTFCAGDSVTLTSSTAVSYLWNTNATTQSIKVKTSGNYSVMTGSGIGCSANSSATTVTVNTLPATPSITASGATTFCYGDSVILSAGSANAYLWSNNATTQSINIRSTGNYSVKITDNNGCSATSSAKTVTVNTLPSASITASGVITFCAGDSVTLSSNSASVYLWSNNATSQSIKVRATGNYSVKITDANGCSATSASKTVTVNNLPTVSITAGGPTTFCAGNAVNLSATSANAYLWSNSATTQTINATTSGNYSVKITDANGCSATSAATTITVNALPTASITAGGPATFCSGDSVTLTAASANAYLWSNNATTQSIIVKSSGNYDVKVTNGNGCSATSTATNVKVNALPVAIISAGGPTTFCAGDSVILSTGTASAYLWNNNAVSQSISVRASGNYSVKITDINGCSATSSATAVKVNALPTPSITANTATTFCAGDSVILSTGSSSAYLWSNNAVSQSIVVKSSGNYKVKVTDGNGCSASSNATGVTVNALPISSIAANKPTTFCAGDSVELSATAANTYLWSNNATSQNINVKSTGNYSVKITDGNGCSATSTATGVTVNNLPVAKITAGGSTTFCDGDSVILSVGSADAYLWNNNATTQNIKVTSSGNYQVKITDANACSNTSPPEMITVNALPIAVATANGPLTFCAGDSVTLSAGAANAYLWSNNTTAQNIIVQSSGNYSVKITDGNGCSSTSNTIDVKVNALPPSVISADKATTFCQGDSVTLSANIAKYYDWNNGMNIKDITVSASGNYSVKVTDDNGCSSVSTPMAVKVNALPIAEITSWGNPTFCQGDSLKLIASSGQSFLWNTGSVKESIVVSTAGNFIVTVKDINGCSATSPVLKVKVNALPQTPVITPGGPTTFCSGDSVILTTGFSNYYFWSNIAKTQSINVKTSGNYNVKVTDANGCSAASGFTMITVNASPAKPVVTANRSTNLCTGDSVTLSTAPSNAYLWSTAATTQNISVATTGNYKVEVTDINGCRSISDIIPVKMNASPTAAIKADGPTTFCEGGEVILTASGAGSYLWSNNASAQSILVDASDDLSVVVTDANGCSDTSDVTVVTVNELPAIPSITIAGKTLTSSAKTGNQWYLDGKKIAGATEQTYTIAENGHYTVEVSNGNCTSVSSSLNFSTLGVAGITKDIKMLIYPNPNHGRFNIQLGDVTAGHIRIVNAVGEIVYESDILASEIDLSGRAYGVYSVQVITTEKTYTGPVVIQ